MNAISELKNLIGKPTDSELEGNEGTIDSHESSGLFQSMNAVDEQMAESDKMRMTAELAVMESELTSMIGDDMADTENDSDVADAIDAAGPSKRALELSRRRATINVMRHEIGNSAAILKSVAQNADLIFQYLNKSERDLEHLEAVESSSVELEARCKELTDIRRKALAKIAEQQKQIHVLDAKKNQGRERVAELQAELNKANAEVDRQRSTISVQATKLGKLEDDLVSKTEELSSVQETNSQLWGERDSLTAQNEALETQIEDQQKALAEAEETNKVVTEDAARTSTDLKEVRAKYKTLGEKYTEQKSELEDKAYELDRMATDFEEKFRLKDAHIFKLESEVNVSEKQVMLADDMIANLKHKLDQLKKSEAQKDDVVVKGKAKTAAKSSSIAAE